MSGMNDSLRRPTNMRRVRKITWRERWTGWRTRWQEWRARPTDDEEAPERPAWLSSGVLLRVAAVAAAALCLTLLAVVAMNIDLYTDRTKQFHVAKFRVLGNRRVSEQAIIAASGVKPNSSLMTLEPQVVVRQLEQMPWIRRASVQQVLPDTLVLRVQEYEPFALLLGRQLTVVDKSGYVFKVADPGEADDLPILTGLPSDLIRAGQTVGAGEATTADGDTPTRRKLRELLHLIEAHAVSPVAERFPLSEVHYDAVLGTTLISAKDGAEVRIGHAMEANLPRAFAFIGRLLDRVDQRGEWLQYALLDDDLRTDRAVVASQPLAQRPKQLDGTPAGGAGQLAAPQSATETEVIDD
jgi:hypothetical protein